MEFFKSQFMIHGLNSRGGGMKKIIIWIVRLALTGLLIFGAYREAGIFTALAFLCLFGFREIDAFSLEFLRNKKI